MIPDKGKAGSKEDAEIIKFSDSSSFNLGYIFFGLAGLVSIVATFFFWSASNSIAGSLAEKKSEKDSIVAEITSPTYKDVEKNASDFKAAVVALKSISQDKYSISDFLPEFYKHITKDVQIKNIAMKNKDEIAFDGTTTSYRSVADLVVALQTWPVLSEVKLNTVSLNIGKDGKAQAVFSISAKIDPAKKLKEEVAANSTDTTSSMQSGGEATTGSTSDTSSVSSDGSSESSESTSVTSNDSSANSIEPSTGGR